MFDIYKVILTDGKKEILYMLGAEDKRRAVILAQAEAIKEKRGIELVSVEKSVANDNSYIGNLNSIYKNKFVKKYIKEKVIGGYLNHQNRNNETDTILEDIFNGDYCREFIGKDMLAKWVCSKQARHFMDNCNSIEYFNENIIDNILEFKFLI